MGVIISASSSALPDLPFDANDVAAWGGYDAFDPVTAAAYSTLTSKVGAAQTLTRCANGTAMPALPLYEQVPGPFGGSMIMQVDAGIGWLGADSAFNFPATFTLTWWQYDFLSPQDIAIQNMLFLGRTTVSTPGSVSATFPNSYGFAVRGVPSVTSGFAANDGSQFNHWRAKAFGLRNSGAGYGEQVCTNATSPSGQMATTQVGRLNHFAITYDGSYIIYYQNGYGGAYATVAGPHIASGTGYFFIGCPAANTATYRCAFSRVRLSNIVRPLSHIQEQARRGRMWPGALA